MPDPRENDEAGHALNDRILDALVYLPAGLVVAVADEIPKLAALGRDHLGVRVSSARAVGAFAVQAGKDELVRRSERLWRGSGGRPSSPSPASTSAPAGPGRPGSAPSPAPSATAGGGNGHVPPVSALAIPGFDTLSASQVVQRLDGLNRVELVSVRAYEASTRGRRTILNRVDQLLDERS
jgi:hypothetical protein